MVGRRREDGGEESPSVPARESPLLLSVIAATKRPRSVPLSGPQGFGCKTLPGRLAGHKGLRLRQFHEVHELQALRGSQRQDRFDGCCDFGEECFGVR